MADYADYCAPVLRRPLFCVTLLWIGGILLAVRLPLPWGGWLVAAASFFLFWLLAGLLRPRLAALAISLAVLTLAAALGARLLAPPSADDPRYLPPGGVSVQGYPLETAASDAFGWRVRFRLIAYHQGACWLPRAGDIELRGRGAPPAPGHGSQVRGMVEDGDEPGNPYGFSRSAYLAQRGIRYRVRASSVQGLQTPAPLSRTDLLRAWLAQRFTELLPGAYGPLYGQLLNGLVLGLHGAALPAELVAQFRRAGTIHLMVVSGSQITLFSAVLLFPFWFAHYGRRRTSYPRLRMVLLLLSLPLLALYVLLADRGPSVDRAVLMVLLSTLALFLAFSPLARTRSFRPDNLTLLSAAALIMFISQPALLFSPSLQLSFAAVFGLLTITPILMRLCQRTLGPMSLLPSATLGAQLMTYPVLAWHFGTIPVLGAVTNLIAVPAVAVILPVGLLMLVFLPWCPAVAGALGLVVTPLLQLLLTVSAAAAQLPWAEIHWVVRSPWTVLCYYAVLGLSMLLLARWLHRKEEAWKIPAGREPRLW
ncbi:MAG TPA: ComEC/Rec2 family competence protein [Armatimonadota bacterium]|jgi:competence protein ComEC